MTGLNITQKPPFLDNKHQLDIKTINSFSLSLGLDESQRDFIVNLMSWCNATDDQLSLYTIAPRTGLSVIGLRKRLEKLALKGVFKVHKVRSPHSGRFGTVYRFHCARSSETSVEGEVLPRLEHSSGLRISSARQELFMKAGMDNLFHAVLFAALPAKRSKRALTEPLSGTVNWFETQVQTTTRTLSGIAPAAPRDLLYFEAILGICHELIGAMLRNDETPTNMFVIELAHIHKLMGIPNDGGNSATTVNVLNRLASTAIDVHNLPEKILNHYGCLNTTGMERFVALNDFGIYSDQHAANKNQPRTVVKFSLCEVNFLWLASNKYLFEVNPSIFKETNDVIIAFHFWCRRRIGQSGKTIGTTLPRLHLDLSPLLSYKEFVDSLFGGLRRRFEKYSDVEQEQYTEQAALQNDRKAPSASTDRLVVRDKRVIKHNVIKCCSINILGYRLILDAEAKVAIVPMVDDPYVGLASRHRRALNRSARESGDIINHPGLHDRDYEDELFQMVQ